MNLRSILAGLALAICSVRAAESFPALTAADLADVSTYGRNIQRTMRLLATSTPQDRHTVRILFYGQSITEQKWAKLVEQDLRQRFTNAILIVENRALGGFASQMLVKTAETDLYPFQPDLLIFHVYGAHNTYEDIIRRVRERTTAEILMQNDHVTKPEAFTEETDPAKLPPAGKHWDAFMNHNWLPSLAKKYQAELCDQRAIWKRYLKANHLEPKALLKDNVHLNAHGEYLMAKCVKAYLRYDPKLGRSPAEDWVKTIEPAQLRSADGALETGFDGGRVELVLRPGTSVSDVRIDNKALSDLPELYGFTRAMAKPGGKWPVVAPIGSDKPLVLEDWTMDVRKSSTATNAHEFTLRGSKTGEDGSGRSDQRFVSKSGRVVMETNAWNVSYAMALAGVRPVPAQFTVRWSVVQHGREQWTAPNAGAAGTENAVTLAEHLPPGAHQLRFKGNAADVIALHVYRPPLAR